MYNKCKNIKIGSWKYPRWKRRHVPVFTFIGDADAQTTHGRENLHSLTFYRTIFMYPAPATVTIKGIFASIHIHRARINGNCLGVINEVKYRDGSAVN